MDAILWADMKHWDPSALLALCSGPLCTIAMDHFARLAIACDRRFGATSMVGGGTADRHAAVSPNLMQVRGAVLNGVLRPGSALPSPRTMASRLGVARACVVAAYDQLSTEGYVETRLGSGAFVCADLQDLGRAKRRVHSGGRLHQRVPLLRPAAGFVARVR